MNYRVKQWRQFQHYRDRNPPWIKLHFSLLSSMDWVTLNDESRVLAIACMLIASRNDGCVPGNPDYIRRVAYLHKAPNFKPLIECGFLEPDSDCKQMLADARPETETETEKRQSREVNSDARPRGTRLQPDWFPTEDQKRWAGKTRPDLDVATVVDSFRDYWVAAPGQKGVKLDWDATFRNWVRNQRGGEPVNTGVATDWTASSSGIEKRGAELGIFPTDPRFGHWQEFKAAVLRAAQERAH